MTTTLLPAHVIAIEEAADLLRRRNWVDISVNEVDGSATLTYGTIHTNGDREQPIGTRRYYANGNVSRMVHA